MPLAGGPASLLTNNALPYQQAGLADISATSQRFLFTIATVVSPPKTPLKYQVALYSRPFDGGDPAKLVEVNQNTNLYYARFSPGGDYVIYTIGSADTSDTTTYAVSVTGGAPTRIADRATFLSFGANGDRFAYWVDNGLYSYSFLTHSAVRVSLAPPPGKNIVWSQISPDGEWALYAVGKYESEKNLMRMDLLYSVSIRGGHVGG